MWGEAPPRKPNFQASKLPNFLISFGAGKWGAGGRTIVRPALAPHLSCKICVFADSFSPDKIAWQLRFHHCGILPRDMKQEQASELVWQMSETFRVGALLACVGGFLDAYTFLCRGGVFANAQTGNLALRLRLSLPGAGLHPWGVVGGGGASVAVGWVAVSLASTALACRGGGVGALRVLSGFGRCDGQYGHLLCLRDSGAGVSQDSWEPHRHDHVHRKSAFRH